jgi:hypothetical protein
MPLSCGFKADSDRRRLSRYMRRWLVERFFAWIQWQRRILVRWEYHAHNFLRFGVLQINAAMIQGFMRVSGRKDRSR